MATRTEANALGTSISRRLGSKRVYLLGVSASLLAMTLLVIASLLAVTLLVISSLFTGDRSVAYPLHLTATAFVGAGFGLTVPSLNTFTAVFHPSAIDRSILVLNALLGLGTALAPVFVAVFVGLGFWWGLPILSAALLAALTTIAALALTTFWAMVTLGRVLFASIQRWLPTHRTYQLFGLTAIVGLVLGALAFVIARRETPAALHPRPHHPAARPTTTP